MGEERIEKLEAELATANATIEKLTVELNLYRAGLEHFRRREGMQHELNEHNLRLCALVESIDQFEAAQKKETPAGAGVV